MKLRELRTIYSTVVYINPAMVSSVRPVEHSWLVTLASGEEYSTRDFPYYLELG